MARGKHLFPFRTEKLSLSAPMVLGSQGPGRVGRRRFTCTKGRPPGRPFVVKQRRRIAVPLKRRSAADRSTRAVRLGGRGQALAVGGGRAARAGGAARAPDR